jgi:hypothetical protein
MDRAIVRSSNLKRDTSRCFSTSMGNFRNGFTTLPAKSVADDLFALALLLLYV